MYPATVNTSTFTLAVGGVAVSGSVGYDASSRTATFSPASGILAEGQSYVATVTTGVKDLAGNSLASNYMFSFTTVDNTPPTIISRSPAPGAVNVPASTTIQVGFSEPMTAASITTSTFVLSVGGTGVPSSVSYNTATRIATLTPNSALTAGQSYTVTVSTGVRDANGNALASADTFTFTVAGSTQANIGGLSRPGDGNWSGSTSSVHFHIVFAQSGQSLSLGTECPGPSGDLCYTNAINAEGATAVGPASPGFVWVNIQSISGTVNGTQANFTRHQCQRPHVHLQRNRYRPVRNDWNDFRADVGCNNTHADEAGSVANYGAGAGRLPFTRNWMRGNSNVSRLK